MSKRTTPLDKAIKSFEDDIAALTLARDKLIALRRQGDEADLAAARPPKLKTVSNQ